MLSENNSSAELQQAYSSALKFTKSHYENFPVVSFLIPKNLRKHIAVIYQFARQADDIADEGNADKDERLKQLEGYESKLRNAAAGKFADEFWFALNNTINYKSLTAKYFFDLLSAFKQDVIKNRYADFDELTDYCSRSANPVGRIVLELFNIRDEKSFTYSDSICTALQLANFFQDVKVDYKKNRIYIPESDIINFGVSEKEFEVNKNSGNFKQLMKFEIDRTERLFIEGRNLLNMLPLRLKMEISWTILGGMLILNKIKKFDYDVLNVRPKLYKFDFVKIFIKSFLTAE